MGILLDGVRWEPSLFVEGSCFGGDGAQGRCRSGTCYADFYPEGVWGSIDLGLEVIINRCIMKTNVVRKCYEEVL